MSEPFLSEIRLFSFNFAPRGWALCNGQLLPINQNQALFALLGTTFGGNGQTTFALPDLRGRVPIHTGSGHTLGERAGEENHTISTGEMATHIHGVQASASPADSQLPEGNLLARSSEIYGNPANLAAMIAGSITNSGGSQPHLNLQPYLTVNFCIALQGIFPSRN